MKNTCNVVLMLCLFGLASVFAGDYDAVVDDSVVGYWRFNDPNDYGKDSSGHGSGIVQWNNGARGSVVSGEWSRGGGFLELPRNGSKSSYTYGNAVATVTSGKGFSLSRTSPGWTVATWVRGSAELVSSLKNAYLAPDGTDAGNFKNALKDGNWHPLVIVYRANNSSDFYRVYVDAFDSETVTDITAGGTDSKGSPAWHIPLDVSSGTAAGDTVILGGDVGGSVNVPILGKMTVDATFFGGLDDCIIIDRELAGGGQKGDSETVVRTDDEVFRWVQTGETFVFSKGSSGNMFYEKGNWSNNNVPQTGLAYMIENGYEVKSAKTATFAGKSLSVGRTEKLYGIKSVGGSKEIVVDNTVGKLTQQGANTMLTVDDLRLNDGVLASVADGQSLFANVTVSASNAKPFEINVATGTYRITGRMTGGGCVVKRGLGTLDLSGLSELNARIVVEAGTVRLPGEVTGSIDYSGGEIVVAHDDAQTQKPILIRSSTVWPIVCTVEGEFGQVGSHALFAVPNSVKEVVASDFAVTMTAAFGLETEVRIEKGDAVQCVLIDVVACDRYTVGLDTFEECVVVTEQK